jgi:DNA-binding NarL/FixJ family response regulator
MQAAGRWQEAAEVWGAAGCPYEHAAALAESPGSQVLLDALRRLDQIGAEPLVRVQLRGLGADRIPRGSTPDTRENPARLTSRQMQVTGLLCKGRTNAEVADELTVSVRTVGHHVAAVLLKLVVTSRRDIIGRATTLGLLDDEYPAAGDPQSAQPS